MILHKRGFFVNIHTSVKGQINKSELNQRLSPEKVKCAGWIGKQVLFRGGDKEGRIRTDNKTPQGDNQIQQCTAENHIGMDFFHHYLFKI